LQQARIEGELPERQEEKNRREKIGERIQEE